MGVMSRCRGRWTLPVEVLMRLDRLAFLATVLVLASAGPSRAGDDSTCPVPGDIAPGTLDTRTQPPTWRPVGDGRVTVTDVVAELRAAVGLQVIAGPDGGTCPSMPGDLSPGLRDVHTLPSRWTIRGDGRTDISDVIATLRASLE